MMEDSGTVWTDQLWFQADLIEVKKEASARAHVLSSLGPLEL